MQISIHSLLEGAKRATGTVAVIDVFRAFTTAAVALANGALSIVMVRTVQEALALRDTGIGQICMGEVRGRAPDGFGFATRHSRSQASISEARQSSSGPVQARRALSRRAGPKGFMRHRWSRQRRLFALFSQIYHSRSPSSQWATMASREPTKTSYVPSIFGTA